MKYNDETIILIEYYNNIPVSVMTEYSIFDFELYNGEWLMFNKSSIGQNFYNEDGDKIIMFDDPDSYESPEKWKIWVENGYICEKQEGVELLKRPLMVSFDCDKKLKYNNPLVVGEEVDEIYYCEKCGKYFNDDGCPTHGYRYVQI